MSVRIAPLRLEAFEQLPKHARQCVFWEVDPATLGSRDYLPDPEFEKEAWLSMVMLEWGSCGQVASTDGGSHEVPRKDVPVGLDVPGEDVGERCEERCVGYALYAPPGAVPRVQKFPTAPVSPDAVLLMSVGIESGQSADLGSSLIAQVVTNLVRRGVRALEAFGYTPEARELLDGAGDPELRPAIEGLGDCSFDECMIDASFLLSVGFTVVSPHRYFPRLRLELDKGLGWKAEVEAALERLLENAALQPVVGCGAETS